MKKIIKENSSKIKALIRSFLGEANEDIEQEVYLRTYKNLPNYKEENKFSKWILTITANLCRDYLKSASFKHSSSSLHDEEVLDNIKYSKTPEMVYSQKERQKLVLKAVYSLPKKYKEIIILFEFEDYTYEAIAKKLNIPVGTVKSRISSARKILSEKLSFLIEG